MKWDSNKNSPLYEQALREQARQRKQSKPSTKWTLKNCVFVVLAGSWTLWIVIHLSYKFWLASGLYLGFYTLKSYARHDNWHLLKTHIAKLGRFYYGALIVVTVITILTVLSPDCPSRRCYQYTQKNGRRVCRCR